MDERDERKQASDDASKRTLDGIETGVSLLLRDQRGRHLLADHAASGVQEA